MANCQFKDSKQTKTHRILSYNTIKLMSVTILLAVCYNYEICKAKVSNVFEGVCQLSMQNLPPCHEVQEVG